MNAENTIVVFDGHNDILLDYAPQGKAPLASFFERNADRQVDLPRAKAGGFGGGFYAVFIPDDATSSLIDDLQNNDEPIDHEFPEVPLNIATQVAMSMTANLYRLEALSDGQFKVVRTVQELDHCLKHDVHAAILHFEGAEPIDPDLNTLEVYYKAGLRSLGIVWSRPTAFGYGVPFGFNQTPDTGPGLTDAGKALVKACNELGILIDLSHLNEKGFWDVAKLSDAPLVATHSCVHALSPVTRNLTDKQLDAIKESDGMVGLNFCVAFLRDDGRMDTNTSLDVMVQHIDYLVERLGVERVGLGSDYGVTPMPEDLSDVSNLQKLIDALRNAGYDDGTLRKIAHENWLRVLDKTWK